MRLRRVVDRNHRVVGEQAPVDAVLRAVHANAGNVSRLVLDMAQSGDRFEFVLRGDIGIGIQEGHEVVHARSVACEHHVVRPVDRYVEQIQRRLSPMDAVGTRLDAINLHIRAVGGRRIGADDEIAVIVEVRRAVEDDRWIRTSRVLTGYGRCLGRCVQLKDGATLERVKQLAGSFEVQTQNNGAAALNGDVVICFWVFA